MGFKISLLDGNYVFSQPDFKYIKECQLQDQLEKDLGYY